MLDEMLALLYSHPQVNVDVGFISWALPRAEFHAHLRRLVEAGLGRRVMFGSDQMIWPETLPVAIEAIEVATFLSAEQKRDILHNNAARFLRLTPGASRARRNITSETSRFERILADSRLDLDSATCSRVAKGRSPSGLNGRLSFSDISARLRLASLVSARRGRRQSRDSSSQRNFSIQSSCGLST
jgi:hypothetical protein